MANPYEMFQADEKLETQGITLDYGDFKIRIARAGGSNKKYLKVLEEKFRPHRRAQANGTLNEEVASLVLAEVFAEAVLLGWEGVTDQEGKPMAFNKENATKLLVDLPDLFGDIRDQASSLSLFQAELKETAAKNS